jgi:hypothetical protein
MEFSRIYRQWSVVVGLGVLLIGFQNCAKAPGTDAGATGLSQGLVIGVTSQFTKLTFDPQLESRLQKTGDSSTALDIDLDSGSVVYREGSASKTCRLDGEREQELRRLLSAGRVCKLPEVSVSCMALSLADIKLASADDSVLLRKPLCNNGTYLCDGDDDTLRGIIQDLLTHPLVNCQ